MIERLEKEDKIWQAQVKQIPDFSKTDTKLPIQRTNSSASIDTLNLFGDGSADDRSELRTNSDSHEAHGDKMSSGSSASKKIEADAVNRVKSVSMENREFDNKTNSECEVDEGVEETDQMQEETDDGACSQTSSDSDSGYFGSLVDVSIHLGSSVHGPYFLGSSVDIEPQGSAVGSKPIDSSCFKSMDSTCFISEDTKSHGSSDPILSCLSKRDPLEHLAEMNGKLLYVDEIVELTCPEDRKPLVEVSSGSAHLEHSSNRYTSASPQLKQCNLYPKGEVLLDISDKQDGLAEQMNLTTTEMIETKEYVSAEIDHETFIQMKEEPFMDNWFTKDNICCHNFVVSKHSSQPGHGTVILHNSMPPSSHATERVEESQTREIVKHSKCSKRKKHMIHDLKMDSILLQKMQEKDNFMLLTNKEILQDRNDYEYEKFIKEKNLSVVKEKNLIVEKREDGKIYAHQITIHIYGITKTKFPEIIKRPRRKSKKKNSRSREKRCSFNVKRMSKRKRIISMVRRGEKQNLNVLTKKRGIKAKEDRIRKRPAFTVQHAGAISYLLSLLRKFLSSGIIPQGLTFLYFCVNGVEGARPTNESYEDYIMYFVRSFFDLLQHLGGSQNFEWRVPIAIGSGAFSVSSTARVPGSSGRGADPPDVFPLASRDIPDTDRVVDIWDKDRHVHRLRVSARETFDIYEKIGPILSSIEFVTHLAMSVGLHPVGLKVLIISPLLVRFESADICFVRYLSVTSRIAIH
ncbi:hypothetical protein FSP39_020587 [Pinctada imbricata]|uniref:Uncharacterized protein n=1 Tax=Pinctada imbricata TaxID=66713 RepID=A0AA88XTF1_PINIB|nr:hypothetical protein FSP39_020587 [Pinctada imbricata]